MRLAFPANPVRSLLPSFLVASAFFLGAASRPARAQYGDGSPRGGLGIDRQSGPQTEADLVAESKTIRPGQPFTVALHLTLEKDWHIYWRNPGDSGAATRLTWTLPAGFKAGATQWPTPRRFVADSLVAYGFENEVWLLTEITPPATLPPGKAVTLSANADWLICNNQCVPQKKTLDLTLNVSPDTPLPDEGVKANFAAARAHLPIPALAAGFSVSANQPAASLAKPAKASLNLRFVPPAKSPLSAAQLPQLYFYPADESTLSHPLAQKVLKEGPGYRLPLITSEYAEAPLKRLRGVLIAPTTGTPTPNALSQGIWIDIPITTTLPAPKK